jgi:hypothetical protein
MEFLFLSITIGERRRNDFGFVFITNKEDELREVKWISLP